MSVVLFAFFFFFFFKQKTAYEISACLVGSEMCIRDSTGATLDGRDAHDVLPGGLPGLLHDPRERAILPRRFGPDLLQHFLGKIETLLSLVAGGHARQRTPPWAAREFATPAPYGARVLVTSQLTSHLITSFPPFN